MDRKSKVPGGEVELPPGTWVRLSHYCVRVVWQPGDRYWGVQGWHTSDRRRDRGYLQTWRDPTSMLAGAFSDAPGLALPGQADTAAGKGLAVWRRVPFLVPASGERPSPAPIPYTVNGFVGARVLRQSGRIESQWEDSGRIGWLSQSGRTYLHEVVCFHHAGFFTVLAWHEDAQVLTPAQGTRVQNPEVKG